ncbi:MAG: choice-of-anchor J domain-containing protein [Phycisphaerae bacterium]|jgi:hypothetical protein
MTKVYALMAGALVAAAPALAGFTATAAGPINSDGLWGSAANGWFTYDYAGADFYIGDINFFGEVTSGGVGSYQSELLVGITDPLGNTAFLDGFGPASTWTGKVAVGPLTFPGLGDSIVGTAGTYTFTFCETYDDVGLDAFWENLSIELADGVEPPPAHPWPTDLLWEDFEAGVPPTGWSAVTNNPFTWEADVYDPYEGLSSATCFFDEDNTGSQDEWLITPVINTMHADVAVGGQTRGSLYWGGGEPNDNYDVEVWIVNGADVNDGDDVYVGLLDDCWEDSWVWSPFEYDLSGLYAPGVDFRVGFRYAGSNGAAGSIDAVYITPEPASLVLLALAGLALRRR